MRPVTHAAADLAGFVAVLERLAADPRGPESPADTAYPRWVRSTVAMAGAKLRVLRHLRAAKPRGALLDVGSQVGAFAVYASQLGFTVSAVDLARYARFGPIIAALGVDFAPCDLSAEPLPFPDASFEAVAYLDVVEHHAFSPRRVLLEIHRVLKPGGLLYVTTPNHTSLVNRVSLLLGRSVNDHFATFFADGEGPVYHGHHREYTLRELRAALVATGFGVRDSRVIDDDPAAVLRALRLGGHGMRAWINLGAAAAGTVMETLRLPLGRQLWAVAEKPAYTAKTATTGA